MIRTLLIDGDWLAYLCASSVEYATNWGPDGSDDGARWTVVADVNDAMRIAESHIDYWLQRCMASEVVVVLSKGKNFRNILVDKSYKANREGNRKPIALAGVREALRQNYPFMQEDGLEADDVIGVTMTTKNDNHSFVAVSIDKDFQSIPGWLFNPLKNSVSYANKAQADRYFLKQALIGDPVDGYSGVPKFGDKGAEEFLDSPYKLTLTQTKTGKDRWVKEKVDTYWEGVVSLFERQGLTEADALTQARLARILRNGDYDFTTGVVRLWTPDQITLTPPEDFND